MSPLATLGAVLLAYLPAAVSPGPNFVLIAHTAAAGTRRAAVAVALGVVAAGGVLAAVAVFGLGSVLARTPWLATALRVVCGGYLAWLGVRLWWQARASGPAARAERENKLGDRAVPDPGKPLRAAEMRGNGPDRPTPETAEPHRAATTHQAEPADPPATDGAEPPRPTAVHDRGDGKQLSRSSAGPPNSVSFFRQGVVSNLTNPKAAAFFGSVLTAALPPTEPTPVKAAAVGLIVAASTAWHLSVALLFSSPATQRWYAHAKPALNRVVGTILVLLGVTLAVTK